MTDQPRRRIKPSERQPSENASKSRRKETPDIVPSKEEVPAPFAHLTNKKQRAFLQAYCITGQVLRAAEAANCSRWSHYVWMRKDLEYRRAFRECERMAGDYIESQAYRLAVEGLRRIKFDRSGKPLVDPRTGEVYVEDEYSIPALLALLKAVKPHKYRDKSETKHTVSFDKVPAPGEGLSDFIRQRMNGKPSSN